MTFCNERKCIMKYSNGKTIATVENFRSLVNREFNFTEFAFECRTQGNVPIEIQVLYNNVTNLAWGWDYSFKPGDDQVIGVEEILNLFTFVEHEEPHCGNDLLLSLLKTDLKSGKIAKVLDENSIRLSVMGWSKYYVEDGRLIHHHHLGDVEYISVVSSIDEITLFDEDCKSPFEYSQEITSEMVRALRSTI